MNEKHAAITMLLLVWNEPLRTCASHARLDFALNFFFRFGSSLYFFHLREGPPCLSPKPPVREGAVSGETYLPRTPFLLLLCLYYLAFSRRNFYILGALYASSFFGLGCSVWVCDMTLLILPSSRCSRPFYLLVAYLINLFLFLVHSYTTYCSFGEWVQLTFCWNEVWTCIFGSPWLSDTY